jgi:Domain of unknown function (DUF3854)
MSAQVHARYTYTRVSRRQPCPVCEKHKYCEFRSDGAIHCMSVESAYPCEYRNGGWMHNLPGRSTTPLTIVPKEPETLPERADAATCDTVYRTCLEIFPLSSAHRDDLLRRELSADSLGNFGSMPPHFQRRQALAQLEKRYGRPTLLTVPGFIEEGGELRLNAATGLLLAVVGNDGLIAALNVRNAPPGGKKSYIWVSSARKDSPSSGSPCHVVKPEGAPSHKVLVTEGVIKAEIAARRMGLMTIGMVGHTPHTAALELLAELASHGVESVIIAFDEDANPDTRVLVEKSRRRFAAAALALFLTVRYARWDHANGKGIDDLLVSGHQPTIEPVKVVLVGDAPADEEHEHADDNPGTVTKGIPLPQAQQAARYRLIKNVLRAAVPYKEGKRDEGEPKRAATAVQKLTVLLGWELHDNYPYPGRAPQPEKKAKPYLMAACAGTTVQTVTAALTSLAAIGVIEHRTEKVDTDDGKRTVVWLRSLRPYGFNEVIPKPARTEEACERARARRKCNDCGSELITVSCRACGFIEKQEPLQPLKFSEKHAYEKHEEARRDAEWQEEEQERREAARHASETAKCTENFRPSKGTECVDKASAYARGVDEDDPPICAENFPTVATERPHGAPWDGRPAIEKYPWFNPDEAAQIQQQEVSHAHAS